MLLRWSSVPRLKFYNWRARYGTANEHNGKVLREAARERRARSRWAADEGKLAVPNGAREHVGPGRSLGRGAEAANFAAAPTKRPSSLIHCGRAGHPRRRERGQLRGPRYLSAYREGKTKQSPYGSLLQTRYRRARRVGPSGERRGAQGGARSRFGAAKSARSSSIFSGDALPRPRSGGHAAALAARPDDLRRPRREPLVSASGDLPGRRE